MIRKLAPFALAGIAVALAGTAYAASSNTHVMNVSLPDGSIARVEYVGNVAPKVTVAPATVAPDLWTADAMPTFAGFDRMFQQIDLQMRQLERMARQPAARPNMNVASFGNLPAGANSVSVVSYSNGGSTCTRTTEVTSQGPGKPPKVTSNVSGACGVSGRPTVKSTALDRT